MDVYSQNGLHLYLSFSLSSEAYGQIIVGSLGLAEK